jgi:phospholipid transport system substrate-binding protein
LVSALIIFSSLLLSFNSAHSTSFKKEATLFVEQLVDKATKKLTDKTISRDERVEHFKVFFNNHFAVEGIGKWILGRYWRQASEKERNEYLILFEDMMVFLIVDRFSSYTGKQLHIHKSEVQDEKNVTVFSNILKKNGKPAIRVDWRVARSDHIIKVVDVVIEGTSISSTLRSDFNSTIRSRGRSISGLLEVLRKKTAKLRKKVPG